LKCNSQLLFISNLHVQVNYYQNTGFPRQISHKNKIPNCYQ